MYYNNIIPNLRLYTPKTVICERTRETLTNYKLLSFREKRIYRGGPGGGADVGAAGNPMFASKRVLRRIVYG